jgi:hypothetical protein
MAEKTAVFSPIPSASVSTAMDVNPGFARRTRTAYRRSAKNVDMIGPQK